MELLFIFFITALTFVINLFLTPQIIKVAHHFRWYDRPTDRKIHTTLIPRLGGVGIFTAFFFSVIIAPLVWHTISGWQIIDITAFKFIPLFTSFFIIYILGLVDDFWNLKAWLKFGVQLLAAVLLTFSGFRISSISFPYLGTLDLWYFSYPITVLWLVGIMNAINLVDGMDGLGGGIAGLASLALGIIALLQHELEAALLAFALFGSLVAFLCYNFPPAKIFMGDSGSLFIGFILAVIPLFNLSHEDSLSSLLIPVTILLVPIFDTAAAIVRRLRKRTSIATPDREHIHHKLLDLGLSEKKILALIYSICLYLSIIAITSLVLPAFLPKAVNIFIIVIAWMGLLLGYGIIHALQNKNQEKKETNKTKKTGFA